MKKPGPKYLLDFTAAHVILDVLAPAVEEDEGAAA
jgi:hypothetical protein